MCPANTVHAICEVSPDGTIRAVAAQLAMDLPYPLGVAVDSAGNLFVADAGSNRIRKVVPDGTITTIAGNGARGFSRDGGPAIEAQLEPQGVAVDGAGNLFIADFVNNRIRKVSPDGIITTIAGDGSPGYSGDGGAATDASISAPFSVAVERGQRLLHRQWCDSCPAAGQQAHRSALTSPSRLHAFNINLPVAQIDSSIL